MNYFYTELEDVELKVYYVVYAACKGTRDEFGQLLEPDEPAYCDLLRVMVGDVDILRLLSPDVVEKLEELAIEIELGD